MQAPSVHLYAVRDALAADLEGTLARVAEVGYARVEAFAFVEQAARLRRALDAAGPAAPSAHASIIEAADPESVLEAAQALRVIELDDYAGSIFEGIATSLDWLREHDA